MSKDCGGGLGLRTDVCLRIMVGVRASGLLYV